MARQRITHMKRLTGLGAGWQQGAGPSDTRVRVELYAGQAGSYWFAFGGAGTGVTRDSYIDVGYYAWPAVFDRAIHGDIVTQALMFYGNAASEVTWVEVFEVDIPDLTDEVRP